MPDPATIRRAALEEAAASLELKPNAIRLAAGEMTPQEMRTVQAVLAWRSRKLREMAAAEPPVGGLLVTHDPERGTSYVYLVGKTPKGGAPRTVVATPGINLDLDVDGRLVGIELLDRALLHPKLAAVAVPPRGQRNVE